MNTWSSSRAETSPLYICARIHLYVFFSRKGRKMLARALSIEDISIPPNFIFFGHCGMKQAALGWKGTHDPRFHIIFILLQNILNGANAFAYGRSFSYRSAFSQKVTASRFTY